MTYANLNPWLPIDDLLLLPLRERIRYVRRNLGPAHAEGKRQKPHLTLDEFAVATGAKDRHRPMGWERGQKPRDYAVAIARLTPYPPEALGGDGEADLVRETFGIRLRELEEKFELFVQGTTARLAALEGGQEPGAQRSTGRPPSGPKTP